MRKYLFKIYQRDETDYTQNFSGNGEYTSENGDIIDPKNI